MNRTEAALAGTDRSVETVVSRGADIDREIKTVTASVGRIQENAGSLESRSRSESEMILQSVAAIEEILANIRAVTGSVVRASEKYGELNESSARGEELLAEVIERSQYIQSRSEALLETNTVIAGIASQTNLLSMNAAIEAAHAGDAGRGSPWSRTRYENLAESAAEQSRTVEEMLGDIASTIGSVASSSRKAGENFGEIQALIRTITRLEEEVKQAMEEQSAGSNEILASLDGMKSALVGDGPGGGGRLPPLAGRISGEMEDLNRYSEDIQASIEAVRANGDIPEIRVRQDPAALAENNRSSADRAGWRRPADFSGRSGDQTKRFLIPAAAAVPLLASCVSAGGGRRAAGAVGRLRRPGGGIPRVPLPVRGVLLPGGGPGPGFTDGRTSGRSSSWEEAGSEEGFLKAAESLDFGRPIVLTVPPDRTGTEPKAAVVLSASPQERKGRLREAPDGPDRVRGEQFLFVAGYAALGLEGPAPTALALEDRGSRPALGIPRLRHGTDHRGSPEKGLPGPVGIDPPGRLPVFRRGRPPEPGTGHRRGSRRPLQLQRAQLRLGRVRGGIRRLRPPGRRDPRGRQAGAKRNSRRRPWTISGPWISR
ncbi:MAG: methyl-accepting chemotaxis protein [Desulfobacterales bacterium]|nr:methyl-accepting chemotaxis protein [Desulfobacterales bacterium]